MNKIDCVSELKGEYNIKVLDGERIVYSSGWRRNTILATGLTQLYDQDASNLTQVLDLGSSSLLPGTQGYSLSGIISRPEYSDFTNIARSRRSSTSEGSTRVFYSYFSSGISPGELILREFAIKSSRNSNAFARNVFAVPVIVRENQYIIFEYRLKIQWYHTFTTKLPFKTSSGHTFTVPVTSTTFNIPYNEVYRKDNVLYLLQNKAPKLSFGDNWPTTSLFSVNNRLFSKFKSVEIGRGLNNNTRTYCVSTVFSNISARPYGLFNQINTFLLSRNSDNVYSTELANDNFLAINMAFPLSLYNYENSFYDLNGPIVDIESKTITLEQLIGPDTDINIIGDSSGSMNSTLTVLDSAIKSGALKQRLLPFYRNDSALYDQRVQYTTISDERTFSTNMLNKGSRGGKKLINIVFQDETTGSTYNNTNSTTYNNDVIQLRSRISTFTPGNFLGFVFQVSGVPAFKTFLTSVKEGTAPFTAVNLKDRPEIKFIYDIEAKSTEQYYTDKIIEALLSIDPIITNNLTFIPSVYRANPYIYTYHQYITNASRYNKFDLYFNYIWREA